MAREGLSALHAVARRRAQAALDRAAAGERRYEEARAVAEAARAEADAYRAGLPARRSRRMASLLEGAPASPLRMARVSLAFDCEQEDLREREAHADALEREQAARARDLAELRERARHALARETKLAAALERLAARERAGAESASELESEP